MRIENSDRIVFDNKDINLMPIHPNQKVGLKFNEDGTKLDFIFGKGKYRVKVNEEVEFYIQCNDIISAMELNGVKVNELPLSISSKDEKYYIELPVKIEKKKKHIRAEKLRRPDVNIRNNVKKFIILYKMKEESEKRRKVPFEEVYRDLSPKLGLSAEAIKKIKDNKVNPSIETAFILCDIFECGLNDLFERVN